MKKGHVRVALKIANLGDSDRTWILDNLDVDVRESICELLSRIEGAENVSELNLDEETAQPVSRNEICNARDVISNASPAIILSVMLHEPAWINNVIFHERQWPWVADVLAMLPESSKELMASELRKNGSAITAHMSEEIINIFSDIVVEEEKKQMARGQFEGLLMQIENGLQRVTS